MAKKTMTPKKTHPLKVVQFPDCAKCVHGVPYESYNFLCPATKTYVPQPNCIERKVMCIYFKPK